VTAPAKLVLLGVPKNVATEVGRVAPRNDATLVPRPDTPVEIGKPVQLVSVPVNGVPSAPPGATKSVPAVAATKADALPFNIPLMLVLRVRAGFAPPDDVPAKPLADTTDTDATVPPLALIHVGTPAAFELKT